MTANLVGKRSFGALLLIVMCVFITVALSSFLSHRCGFERSKGIFRLIFSILTLMCFLSVVKISKKKLLTWNEGIFISALIMTLAWFCIGSLMHAVYRGNLKRTYVDMRAIAEKLNNVNVNVPLSPLASVSHVLNLGDIPLMDGWGNNYMVQLDSSGYYLISYGACGRPDTLKLSEYLPSTTTSFEADMVVRNYQFYRWPEGIAPGNMTATQQ